MDKKNIPLYASSLAQGFIDFELDEDEKENIVSDQESIDYLLQRGYTIDDIGLCDAVTVLLSHDLSMARAASSGIKHPEARADALRSIACFEDRCIR